MFCVLFINDDDGDLGGSVAKSVLGVLSGREEKPPATSRFTLCFLDDLDREQDEELIDRFRQPGVVVTRKEGLNGDCAYSICPVQQCRFSLAQMAKMTDFSRDVIWKIVKNLLERGKLVEERRNRYKYYSLATWDFSDVDPDTRPVAEAPRSALLVNPHHRKRHFSCKHSILECTCDGERK